jgi:hypothetical protein
MPELPSTHFCRPLRHRILWAGVCVLCCTGLSASAWAQGVPAALRACAAESDPGQRLDCYDRQMKHLLPAATAAPRQPQPAPTPPTAPPAPVGPSAAPAAPRASARAAVIAPPTATSAPPAPHHSAAWRILSGGSAAPVTARIARLDRWPDAMVLHLDNGQVWRQIGRASGDLGLRPGARVTIEKHLGSYWLSSRYVSNMQVRLQSDGHP